MQRIELEGEGGFIYCYSSNGVWEYVGATRSEYRFSEYLVRFAEPGQLVEKRYGMELVNGLRPDQLYPEPKKGLHPVIFPRVLKVDQEGSRLDWADISSSPIEDISDA